MSEQPFYNKKWGAADFERYHNGAMPERERHALEKATLEDPFLEEALEGYAITKTPLQDLAYLKKKLAEKKKSRHAWYKSSAVVQVFKVAAILVIFLGLAWLFKIKTSEQKPGIASVSSLPAATENENDKDSATFKIDDNNVSAKVDSVPAFTQPVHDEKYKTTQKTVIEEKAGSTITDTQPATSSSPMAGDFAKLQADSLPAKREDEVEKIDLVSREKKATAPVSISRAIEGDTRSTRIVNQNVIRGRVVDNAGNPVAFANINDRQNNLILSSDKDGYFSLSNRQNATNVKVDVNAIGFETNNVALNANNSENKVVLNESNLALSEVVVTGVGAKTKKQKSTDLRAFNSENKETVNLVNATPVDGWSNFQRFVRDTLSVNPEYDYNKLKNINVQLTFDIDPSGKVTNIVFKQPVSDSVGISAKRIMEALPALKKTKNNKKSEAVLRF